MTVANRGTKRRCPHCGAAFYDLERTPVICPKCQTLYVESPRVPTRGGTRMRAEPVVPMETTDEETPVFDEDEALDREELDQDIMADEEPDEDERRDRE
ncbi:MAG TPA: FYDLN acid domain-containing protein [Magnetospirillum sp.]|nr:FYDLN acid domain-containing protein [Magnetospirillum sp.]